MDLIVRNLIFVNTSFCVFQMPVFHTFLNTRIWEGAYNQALALGITRALYAPVPVIVVSINAQHA